MTTTTETRARCVGNACPDSFRQCCTGCNLECPEGYEPCLSQCDTAADLLAELRQEVDDLMARGLHDEEWLARH